MRYLLRSTVLAAIFGLALFAGPTQVAFGAVLSVDFAAVDLSDAVPGDGVCDSGPPFFVCTLRAAIEESNALGGFDTISFAGLGAGTHTITPVIPLPTITDLVFIDGATAVSYAGAPVIILDGSGGLPAGTDGLKITAGGSVVLALAIVNFPDDGIELSTSGGNGVYGSFIGMDPDGTTVKGNGDNGIVISDSSVNAIGVGPLFGNVISGNGANGVFITGEASDSNEVMFNIIGLDSTATVKKANGTRGVVIQAGADLNVVGSVGAGNVISGNAASGVKIKDSTTTGNTVSGNAIGTNGSSAAGLGNGINGVLIDFGTSNTIGPGNVISGNTDDGVEIFGSGASLNTVTDNKIGTDFAGTAAVANGSVGVFIIGSPSNDIGPGNVISGNTLGGVEISGAGATLNVVKDNKIGTNFAGTAAVANGDSGVSIVGAPSNTIGPGNVISGNTLGGVEISGAGATLNVVKDNKIGTNAAGTAAVANLGSGVDVIDASSNTIGPGNVISGNTFSGVEIFAISLATTGNTVSDNKIGTNAAGTAAIANGSRGVNVVGASSNPIGPGNVISGNTFEGVGIFDFVFVATGNTVSGNKIGTNAAGDTALPNLLDGVRIAASSNPIGPGNVISGNLGDGVEISGAGATLNVVRDNKIGTNLAGTAAVANVGNGVVITGVPTNTVGPGNVISGNTVTGVRIDGSAATGNTVTANFIGTNAAGDTALANLLDGVVIFQGTSNTIGPDNVLSGNSFRGVRIEGGGATGNTISDNTIGLNAAGTAAVPNGQDGVIVTAPSNTVGSGNVISGNIRDGVRISGAGGTGNTITGNSIHDNGALGINNITGGNTELTPPSVTAAGSASGSSDCASCAIEVFSDASDEGETFHGTTTSAAGACPCTWSIAGAVTGPNITATVTDLSGNTSEFSAPFVADTDGDGQLDSVDACPGLSTPWTTPLDDTDCDGSITGVVLVSGELFFVTDPADPCSDTPTMYDERGSGFGEPEPAWPPDINDDQVSDFGDILAFAPHFNKTFPDPAYSARFDFFTDGTIDFGDILSAYPSVFNKNCTDYFAP